MDARVSKGPAAAACAARRPGVLAPPRTAPPRRVPLARAARWLAVLLALPALSGCYLLHTAAGQLEINSKRRPIDQVVADTRTPEQVRGQLERVTQIRQFAIRELGLPDNGSYRYYADVGRPYVVWNVFAAPEFAVEPKTWCFPVAGCVAYRGYFDEARARRYADGLQREGYDVLVGGVPAYSTLGHFADPVLNTWVGWSETHLAGLVFHELSHQLLYVPGDSAFNEAFATVVETEGVRRWLVAAGREPELAAFKARKARGDAVAAILREGRERLRALYAAGGTPEALRAAKGAELERLRAEYRRLAAEWGRGGYDALFGADLNNAALLAVATYQQCVPGLEAELAAVGRDLGKFYARARELAARPKAERRAAVCGGTDAVLAGGLSAPTSSPAPPSSSP